MDVPMSRARMRRSDGRTWMPIADRGIRIDRTLVGIDVGWPSQRTNSSAGRRIWHGRDP